MEKPSKPSEPGRTSGTSISRLVFGLGLFLALSSVGPSARSKTSTPRGVDRATPPWTEPGRRLPPPRPSGSAEAPHPAVHGDRAPVIGRLFPRAGAAPSPTRRQSMARHPAGKGLEGPARSIEVEPGDSLWSIAEERVGQSRTTDCWPKLYEANRRTIGPDPDHIEPGQELTLPEECR
jgi:resuscitation-promoting factor RpfA